jgi:quercetin dioxygenase-like cupin family protein
MRSFSKTAAVALLAASFGITGSSVYAQAPMQKAPAPAAAKAAAPSCAVAGINRTQLLDTPLEGLKGLDGVMYITDIGPGLVAPRHSHPGYEFNYILKGSVSYQVDGQKPFTKKAGEGTYNKRGNIHKVWNPSKTEPAQLVAVLIKDADKGLAICEK